MRRIGRRWLIAGCVVFLLLDVAILIVLGTTIRRDREDAISHERDALAQQMNVSTEMDEQEMQNAMLTELGAVYRYVTLYSEPQCINGSIGIMLSNGAENPYAVQLQLVLFSTSEVIAQTGLIDPGWRVEQIDLMSTLAAGEYQCVARLSFYTPDGSALLGTMGRQVLLKVN